MKAPLHIAPPPLPLLGVLWHRLVLLAWAFLFVWILDRVTLLLADYWFFQSLRLDSVFWTNIRTAAVLFAAGSLVGFGAIAAAALAHPLSRRARRIGLHLAAMAGVVGGLLLARRWQGFLVLTGGEVFGSSDPVFGHDAAFYVFTLPGLWSALGWLLGALAVALGFSLLFAFLARGRAAGPPEMSPLACIAGQVSTPLTLAYMGTLTVASAAAVWLRRYDVLLAENGDSGIFNGPSYLDAVGVLSTVNSYGVTTVSVLGGGTALIAALHLHRRRMLGRSVSRRGVRRALLALATLVLLDLGFRLGVLAREAVAISPNEPVIQLDWIAHHVDATRAAYDLEDLETVRFVPAGSGDPQPAAEALLSGATLRDAPLWPGFVSSLERLIDPQHAQRILQTRGDPTVYGPTLEIFRQHEKLRTYYDFMDVDADRYRVGGETRMFVTAVRELPLVEPQPWLAWWGQRFVLFTHGYGMVMAPAGDVDVGGEPVYALRSIPATTVHPELATKNPRVYYGEGAGSIAYSNVQDMKEFDFPTDEGRAELLLPDSVEAGIRMDSFLKRLVFGWKSGQLIDIVFSRLIDSETRAHVYRTPLERIRKIAPFLYLDSDPFAFVTADGIQWMVNGITHTDRYPASRLQVLGDKSDERSPTPGETEEVNYVRDAVKATIDAYTGQVRLYRVAEEPILDRWARVYPSLFTPGEAMPEAVRAHLQYPVQLFHVQFDDVYILYHMDDPMTFFNMEDMWDDGDEVLGPILDEGRAITFSIEPYHWMAQDLAGDASEGSRFALSMIFTPENAPNLRAIPTVMNDPDDYGRVVVLQVPKGHYVPGPQQADAAIDQSPAIAQQFALWNRRGLEVIRGHTTALVVGDELFYVEPVFLRSRQQPVTQLKQVAVVHRGRAFMAGTLEEAVRAAIGAPAARGVAAAPELR